MKNIYSFIAMSPTLMLSSYKYYQAISSYKFHQAGIESETF